MVVQPGIQIKVGAVRFNVREREREREGGGRKGKKKEGKKGNGKAVRYRPGVAQRVPGS
jgi:hypothetical protein